MAVRKHSNDASIRVIAMVSIIALSVFSTGCGSKDDKASEDVAAIRAMMEKKEADAKLSLEKEQAEMAKLSAAIRASREKK